MATGFLKQRIGHGSITNHFQFKDNPKPIDKFGTQSTASLPITIFGVKCNSATPRPPVLVYPEMTGIKPALPLLPRLTLVSSLIFSRAPITEWFPGAQRSRHRSEQKIYETPVSTVKDPPETAARISQPQFQQERQSNLAQPSSQRSSSFDPGLMPASPQRLSFGRAARIKKSGDFARARREGERIACGCLVANWRVLPAGSPSRLGVVVSSKIGNSVVRSRTRRLLRETYRLHQHEITQPVDLVLVARQSIAGQGLRGVEKDFLTTMKRAGLLNAESAV
jgi:ribonuclease P protein component